MNTQGSNGLPQDSLFAAVACAVEFNRVKNRKATLIGTPKTIVAVLKKKKCLRAGGARNTTVPHTAGAYVHTYVRNFATAAQGIK